MAHPGFIFRHLPHLKSIDFVAANKWPIAVKTIENIQPNIYCNGPDFKNHADDITAKITDEEKAIKSVGGEIKYTRNMSLSSSSLLNKFGYVCSDG